MTKDASVLDGKLEQATEILDGELSNISEKVSHLDVDSAMDTIQKRGKDHIRELYAKECQTETELSEKRSRETEHMFLKEQMRDLDARKTSLEKELDRQTLQSGPRSLSLPRLPGLCDGDLLELVTDCGLQGVEHAGRLLCEEFLDDLLKRRPELGQNMCRIQSLLSDAEDAEAVMRNLRNGWIAASMDDSYDAEACAEQLASIRALGRLQSNRRAVKLVQGVEDTVHSLTSLKDEKNSLHHTLLTKQEALNLASREHASCTADFYRESSRKLTERVCSAERNVAVQESLCHRIESSVESSAEEVANAGRRVYSAESAVTRVSTCEMCDRCNKLCPSCDSSLALGADMKLYLSDPAGREGVELLSADGGRLQELTEQLRWARTSKSRADEGLKACEKSLRDESSTLERLKSVVSDLRSRLQETRSRLSCETDRERDISQRCVAIRADIDRGNTEMNTAVEKLRSVEESLSCQLAEYDEETAGDSKLLLEHTDPARIFNRIPSVMEHLNSQIENASFLAADTGRGEQEQILSREDSEKDIEYFEAALKLATLPATLRELISAQACAEWTGPRTSALSRRNPPAKVLGLFHILSELSLPPEFLKTHAIDEFTRMLAQDQTTRQKVEATKASMAALHEVRSGLEEKLSALGDVGGEVSWLKGSLAEARSATKFYEHVWQVQSLKARVDTLRSLQSSLECEMRHQGTLREMLKKANHDTLSEFVEHINRTWNGLLGNVLGDDLSVRLSFVRELKSPERERPCIRG